MAYVALKRSPGPGGVMREPGDHMPEAQHWRNAHLWLEHKWIKEVPDAEIKKGRWTEYAKYCTSLGLPKAEAVVQPKVEVAAVEVKAEETVDVDDLEPLERLEAKTKTQLFEMIELLGLDVPHYANKPTMIEAIIDSDGGGE